MNKFLVVLFLAGCCLVSCRSVKTTVVHKEIPAITEGKLMKNILTEVPDYQTLFARRIDISLTKEKDTKSFRASLKIKKDEFIQVSVMAPLGIEVARVLLTPDSVKFVDMFHKKYFLSDYNYFTEKFDVLVGYDCFQKILTNMFFDIENCSGLKEKEKKYKLERTPAGYELSTVEAKALSRKIRKLYKKRRKNKDFVLILQRILIDAETFRPLSMSVEDVEEELGVSVDYQDFKEFSGVLFPEKINFKFFTAESKTNVELRFSKLEFNTRVEPNFRISSKYKRIQ